MQKHDIFISELCRLNDNKRCFTRNKTVQYNISGKHIFSFLVKQQNKLNITSLQHRAARSNLLPEGL
jgi:hypothetical protein